MKKPIVLLGTGTSEDMDDLRAACTDDVVVYAFHRVVSDPSLLLHWGAFFSICPLSVGRILVLAQFLCVLSFSDRCRGRHSDCQVCLHSVDGGERKANDKGKDSHTQGRLGGTLFCILAPASSCASSIAAHFSLVEVHCVLASAVSTEGSL